MVCRVVRAARLAENLGTDRDADRDSGVTSEPSVRGRPADGRLNFWGGARAALGGVRTDSRHRPARHNPGYGVDAARAPRTVQWGPARAAASDARRGSEVPHRTPAHRCRATLG